MQTLAEGHAPEKLYKVQDAAAIFNLPAWKLRRAFKRGLIPSYRLLNSRRLVLLSEVQAALSGGTEK